MQVPYATSLGLRGHKHSDIGAGDSVLRGGGDDEDDNHSLEAKSFISRLDRKNKVKKRTRRVCDKDGSANVKYRNVSEKRRRYIWDLYTTLVDAEYVATVLKKSKRVFNHSDSFHINSLVGTSFWFLPVTHVQV